MLEEYFNFFFINSLIMCGNNKIVIDNKKKHEA